MLIKTNKTDLLKGLQNITGVITTKNTLPILSHILIQTKQNTLELIATDLDIGIITTINSEVVEEGAITIPAKRFVDIIKELPESTITITTKKNNTINIECEKAFFKIIGLPKEEFPKLPKTTEKNKIQIPQNTLKEMLTMTFFAVSHDQTRHVLNGVLFILQEQGIKFVATDGRRLVVTQNTQTLPKNTNTKAIVPTKTIQEINKILTPETGDVFMFFDANQAMFVLNNTTIISRLIEGEFPNYEQAIPTQKKDVLVVKKEPFLFAVKRAALLTTPDSQSIKIDVFKNKIVVSKHAPNIGETKEELGCEYTGAEFFIGFNPTYLLEGLKNVKQENLSIEFSGQEKPAVVRDGEDFLYVVLPMQIT
ncbi:MAG: DNA polymerase III subunit beta [Candidatus Omnitrophica bacterium]|nr:DNA polymerase III subunit beta [Candidatus Omnitrophota bacterium]